MHSHAAMSQLRWTKSIEQGTEQVDVYSTRDAEMHMSTFLVKTFLFYLLDGAV